MPRKLHRKLVPDDDDIIGMWRKAVTRPIRIPFKEKKKAIRYRFDAYQVRTAMRYEEHPDYPPSAGIKLRLIKEDERYWIIAERSGETYKENLAEAGLLDDPEPPPLDAFYEDNKDWDRDDR